MAIPADTTPAPPTELFVPASLPGARLDAWLRDQLPHVSRGAFHRLLAEGHIRVNGEPAKPNRAPRAGDRITIAWPAARPAEARPEAIPLAVLHEDDDLLVLDKPPGLVVHPSAGHDDGTLVNALLHHCAGRLSGIGGVARPGIVHRLDKDTSGCLVVAKHDAAHVALAKQFAGRSLGKTYLALVCGVPAAEGGEIRAAIARHPSHRKRMAVTDGGGRAAWTSWRLRERLAGAALLEATLHTGRTHQIRVHCRHIGHPIVGDDTYGERQNARLAELTGWRAPRQMLHAWRLVFAHPATGAEMAFEAPVPEDFRAALARLRGA
ncbi:MAG TPA: RluA family pseudouridine synthase [Verrucomicrobiota bacterium]|nr:RluA family pseudouridine synthase [Verrucomicrobiota bacterium]